jgi:hypothetical protein
MGAHFGRVKLRPAKNNGPHTARNSFEVCEILNFGQKKAASPASRRSIAYRLKKR